MKLGFECGCFLGIMACADRLVAGLSCCPLHEAPSQQLSNILKRCPMLLTTISDENVLKQGVVWKALRSACYDIASDHLGKLDGADVDALTSQIVGEQIEAARNGNSGRQKG